MTLKLVTLNIWNRQGPWPRRMALLVQGLRELEPDVIGLQEVLELQGEDQAREIADALGYHAAYAPAQTLAGGPLTMGNAVVSRWPIVDRAAWPLPAGDEDERTLLRVAVATPAGRLPVYVTHLTWQFHLGHLREQQVRAIDDRVRETRDKDALPPVLMGDFNAEPDSDEIRFLRGLTSLGGRGTYWADCFAVAGEGPGHTFARDNGYAAVMHEPSRRIDYIFVRGPDRALRGEPLAARVVLDRPDGDAWPSDHYGVYAEVSAPAPAGPR